MVCLLWLYKSFTVASISVVLLTNALHYQPQFMVVDPRDSGLAGKQCGERSGAEARAKSWMTISLEVGTVPYISLLL